MTSDHGCCLVPRNIAIEKQTKHSSPDTRHGGAWGERRYNSYSFLTSALDGGEWSASRPGRSLPPEKDLRYPLYRKLGGPQSRPGQRLEEKSFAPAGDRTSIALSSSPSSDTILTELPLFQTDTER
jgi:hypothetical protein